MKLVRLLHTSDLHIGEHAFMGGGMDEEGQRALKAVVDFTLGNGIDLVIIAGDLFDNNRVSVASLYVAAAELRRAGIPVVILPGNHDCLAAESVYRQVDLPRLAANIRVIVQPQGETISFPELDLAVWGKPVMSYGGSEHPLAGIPPRGPERRQIAIAHGYYVGKGGDPIHSFQITDAEITACRRDYVALGHWGTFQYVSEGPVKACYSGSPSWDGTVMVVEMGEGAVGVESRRVSP